METQAPGLAAAPGDSSGRSRVSEERLTAVLYAISSLAARSNDPGGALRQILAQVIALVGASSGSVALVNPDTGKLEIEVQQGLPSELDEVALRLGQGITGWVAFHGKPQLVPDVSLDSRYIRLRKEVRSEMAAPMEDHGQIVGVINVDSDALRGFTEADLDLLVRCTAEATAVMSRLWQLANLREKARQLGSLVSAGGSLVTKLDQQELFDSVTRDAQQILQCRACTLHLYDESHEMVRLVSAATTEPADLEAQELPLSACLAGSVVHTRKQIDYPNVQSLEFEDLLDIPRDPELKSVLATPVLYEGEVLGVLSVFTGRIHRFTDEEKRLLTALAGMGAIALQNSRLYARVFQSEESLRKNEQLTTLGLLAAEIAHEIRNPLTVIKLLYGHLRLEFPDKDPRRTDVRVISEKLDQLEAIVSRVLNFAKAPSSLHSRWPITDIIDDTIVLVRLKLAQCKIHLHFDAPPRSWVVDVNKGQIQQVLLNLLINATQAMPDGGSISIACVQEDKPGAKTLSIDIADTGVGIPEPLRERIFDSFLSGRPDGTGLGLGIAKRILLSHHGDIQLQRTGTTGTTMRISLPLV